MRNRLVALGQQAPEHFMLRSFTPDILPYYQSADVLVLPSLKEGLPNVVLEAMACGLPCVAARASGSRELILQGRTGFTYQHGEVDALVQGLRQCLGPAGRAMGIEARQLVEARYSIRAVADAYEALYAQLLGERTPARPTSNEKEART